MASASRPVVPGLPKRAAARLAELAEHHQLEAHGHEAIGRLLVLQATDPTASTSLRDPSVAVNGHVADCLSALVLPAVRAARSIADIGAGAGWPGFALAAALPHAEVFLVETAARHCRYLTRAAEEVGLANVTVVNERAEGWSEGLGRQDVVTARAVAALPVLCEYAAPLLVEGGRLVAWKGTVSPEEAADGHAAAEQLGLDPAPPHAVTPFPGAREHTLHVFRKTAPTPPRFPRRPGIATKRPLSASS